MIASFVWLVCICAALAGAFARQTSMGALWPYALGAAMPALIGFALWPVMRREWAQIIVILSWLALAILACLVIAFVPMAILFLCAPAAAMLFEREKVIEAMVLSAVFAAILYYAAQAGFVPDGMMANDVSSDWGKKAGLASTIAFLIAAMYAGAADRNAPDIAQLSTGSTEADYDIIPGSLLQVDRHNRVADLSGRIAETVHKSDELQSNLLSDILAAYDGRSEIVEIIEKTRRKNSGFRQLLRQDWDDGGLQFLEFATRPGPDETVYVQITDRSEENQRIANFEAARTEAEQDAESKSLFFAGVSHELRTPLNAIIGFSDMMRSRLFGPLPGKYAEYADLIHDSGQHMLDLIGDVLDLSKVEAGKYELSYTSFDAADVIRSTLKMIRPAADAAEIQLDTEITPADSDLLVEADRKAVRQMLLNLTSNAIKFTPKGGRVVVQAKSAGDSLNITVRDNGVGMSAEDLKKVGQPFVQTQSGQENEARGSGLGLSLVKSLVELHQGRFSLASQKDKGTTAEIFLPLSRSE